MSMDNKLSWFVFELREEDHSYYDDTAENIRVNMRHGGSEASKSPGVFKNLFT